MGLWTTDLIFKNFLKIYETVFVIEKKPPPTPPPLT
jgi:hypothetical protein